MREPPRGRGEGYRESTPGGAFGEWVQLGGDERHLRVFALCNEDPLENAGLGVGLFFGEHLMVWIC